MAGELCGELFIVAEDYKTFLIAEDGITHIIAEHSARGEFVHLYGPLDTEVTLDSMLFECSN